jgi:hypothetical protein
MRHMDELSIDEILEKFSFICRASDERTDLGAITIWLPVKTKAKYDTLQRQSKRRFSRVIKEIVQKAIDRADDTKKSEAGT